MTVGQTIFNCHLLSGWHLFRQLTARSFEIILELTAYTTATRKLHTIQKLYKTTLCFVLSISV